MNGSKLESATHEFEDEGDGLYTSTSLTQAYLSGESERYSSAWTRNYIGTISTSYGFPGISTLDTPMSSYKSTSLTPNHTATVTSPDLCRASETE